MDTKLTCSPRTRAWHIHFLQNFVCNSGGTEAILKGGGGGDSPPQSSISRVQFDRIPFNVVNVKLAEYHPCGFSLDNTLEQAFQRDFLLWTPPETFERQDGSRVHFRLVEGVFAFGLPHVALVTLKLCIYEPAVGSDDAPTSVCMDSITRIGRWSLFANDP
ncbi:hypothetical protein BKA70DRAFT_1291734 [Coprinopsis sp. MPI-PUGE-AT-0042]|nr:hypothetical protein BKA70DRAFT_1291734 [Coprinopsis sp. MPI-PUGE-AT-0042]